MICVFATTYRYRILLVNWFLIFVDTCGVNRSVECVLQCVTARPLSVLKIQLIANDVYYFMLVYSIALRSRVCLCLLFKSQAWVP